MQKINYKNKSWKEKWKIDIKMRMHLRINIFENYYRQIRLDYLFLLVDIAL